MVVALVGVPSNGKNWLTRACPGSERRRQSGQRCGRNAGRSCVGRETGRPFVGGGRFRRWLTTVLIVPAADGSALLPVFIMLGGVIPKVLRLIGQK